MLTYLVPLSPELRASVSVDTPVAVTEFLAARGIVVAAVSIQMDADGDPEALVVEANADPRPDLEAFTPEHVSERVATMLEGVAFLQQYATTVETGVIPSLAQTTASVCLLTRLIFDLLGDHPRIRAIVEEGGANGPVGP